ncbi:hypothetical protein MNV49_001222 [Pseudohyphozyma bogoriensis]|nr:hypothetical protein MNV49_001222 [Pseudohyphozyma bogoriensis]
MLALRISLLTLALAVTGIQGASIQRRRVYVGATCSFNTDCWSNLCSATNGVAGVCTPGGAGKKCISDGDCKSTCKVCEPGDVNTICKVGGDCTSQYCTSANVCALAPIGNTCSLSSLCTSGNCGFPTAGICGKGIVGTPCPGTAPTNKAQCLSNSCSASSLMCAVGVVGKPCITGDDCASGNCVANVCAKVLDGDVCSLNADCINAGSTCVPTIVPYGARFIYDTKGVKTCEPPAPEGARCVANSGCASNSCDLSSYTCAGMGPAL